MIPQGRKRDNKRWKLVILFVYIFPPLTLLSWVNISFLFSVRKWGCFYHVTPKELWLFLSWLFTSPADLPKAPTEIPLQLESRKLGRSRSLADNQAPGLKINIQGRLSKTSWESKRRRIEWETRWEGGRVEWEKRDRRQKEYITQSKKKRLPEKFWVGGLVPTVLSIH